MKTLERAIGLVARHPITAVVLISEMALMLGAAGAPPVALWRVLLIPAYLAHVALAFAIGPHYWILFVVVVGGGYALDRLVQAWREA